jgi:hypothetical protein
VMGNSIALARFQPLMPPPENPAPRVVMLSVGVYPWTGIEKVLWLASRLGSGRFDLVGVALEELSPMPVPENVTAHGVLARDQYDPLMARADVGLGTFSLYEKDMNELDPLKTREYLARGLPFISGHRDPDIPNGFAYALRLPNAPRNVYENLDSIVDFVRSMQGTRIPREAVAHIDTEVKERARVNFFEQVAAGARARRRATGPG